MHTQLKAAIVRIFATKGYIVGMGFLVSERSVLSCAHVITAALHIAEDTPNAPTATILLDFPLIAPDHYLHAHVSFWQPPQPDGGGDIAVLRLDDTVPAGAEAVGLVSAEDMWNRTFRAFGFPNGHDAGVWAPGTLRDRQTTGWVQIEQTSTTGYRVQQGFSGGPVWDEELDGVVGMVVAEERDPTIRAAYMIPTAVLVKALPQLEQQARPPCPYRGLFAFQEQDASVFFGRETFTDQLVEDVQRQSSFAIILGPSGSGKSSVIFAGLFPRLRKESTWLLTHLRPGNAPFQALATALLLLLEEEMTETDRLIENRKLAHALSKGDLSIAEVVERIVQKHQGSSHVLLAIDQFEELYTLCPEPETRQQFLDALVKAVEAERSQQQSRLTVVLTLRADFLGQALAHRPFADILQDAALMLAPMTHAELKTAIEEPAKHIGITFAPGLVERIVDDVENEPGQLPLLEFALTLLWDRQEKRQLTHEAYEEIGRVEGALAQYADQVYEALSEEEKERVHQVSVQMVRPGERTEDTRRLATRGELGEDGWMLARRLSDKRLVVTNATPDGQETAEIVHEALIQRWTRLQTWMNADRAFREWQERLRATIRQWEESKQDEGALLHGVLLTEAKYWLEKRGQELTIKERNYLFHSILNEAISISTWLPRYGTLGETLAFLDTYINAPDEAKRLKSIEALKCLPRTESDDKVYEQLQRFVLADTSVLVRDKAAHAICERGQIALLTGLLPSKELTRQQRQRLIQALANTRNLPGTGLEVQKAVRHAKLRVRLAATLQLLAEYRNAFAIMLFFSFLLGQIVSSLADQISRAVESSSSLQQVPLPIDVVQVVVTLALGLYVFIRRSVIDKKAIGLKECIGIGALVACTADSANFIPQIIARVKDTSEPAITAISFLLPPHLPIDIGVVSIIALSLRLHLRNRSATWLLFLIAILSAGIAALSQQVIAPHITEINKSVSLLSSTDILHGFPYILLNDMFNSYYATFASTYPITIAIAWLLGLFAVFGCLLGFLFGFRSAFTDKQTSAIPTTTLRVSGGSSRPMRTYLRRTAVIGLVGLAVAIVVGSLLSWTLLHRPYTYHRASSFVTKVAWSPHGKYLAFTTSTNSGQGQSTTTAKLWAWDATTGKTLLLHTLPGPEDFVDISWSSNDKYLAFTTSTIGQGQVWVWDATTGKTLHLYTFTSPFPSVGIDWSSNDKYLAFTDYASIISVQGQSTPTVWVWDATTGTTLHLYTFTSPNSSVGIVWSPDSKHFAFTTSTNPGQGQSTTTAKLWVWDATTGKTLLLYSHTGLNASVRNAFWSPNSKHLTFVSEWGKSTSTDQVWDATTGKPLLFYTFTSPLPLVYITGSPDDKYLAFTTSTIGQGQVWVWDATTGKTLPLYTFTSPFPSVGIDWSSNDKYLAFTTSTIGQGKSTTTAQVWDATTGKTLPLYTFTGPETFVDISWSSNDKYLAFTTSTDSGQGQSTTTAQVWDVTTGKILSIYTDSNSFLGSTPFGGRIVWSPTDGKHLAFVINSTDPKNCETSPDSSSCNGTVRIWDDTTKGSMYVLPLGPSAVYTMDLSPDGTRLATGSADGTVRMLGH